MLLAATLLSLPAAAQEFRVPSLDDRRAGNVEFTFQTSWIFDDDYTVTNDTEVEQDSALGLGFGIAYNFTENFALGFDFTWSEPDYDAVVIPRPTTENPNPEPFTISTEADFITGQVKGIWNFREGPFTPFAQAGIGITYYDSNVSDGDGFVSCFFDPIFGYVCRSFAETYDETSLSYGGGLGLRWDVGDRALLKLSYNVLSVNIDEGSDPFLQSVKFEIGTRY